MKKSEMPPQQPQIDFSKTTSISNRTQKDTCFKSRICPKKSFPFYY